MANQHYPCNAITNAIIANAFRNNHIPLVFIVSKRYSYGLILCVGDIVIYTIYLEIIRTCRYATQ